MRGKKFNYNETHKIIDNILYKKCMRHKEFFPNEDEWFLCTNEYFYTNKKNKTDGLHPECKRCGKRKVGVWRKENPQKFKDQMKKIRHIPKVKDDTRRHNKNRRINGKYYIWLKKNPEKAKKYQEDRQHKNHKITYKEWMACKHYFNMRCAYCGLPIEEHYFTRNGITKLGDLHKEHVDHEGFSDLSNCVPACGSCNDKKWKFTFNMWYNKENEVFAQERYDKIIKWINEDYKLYIQE